jgi:hypothetical protein
VRIDRRRLGVATAAILLVTLATLGAIASVRWNAAGVPHEVSPPAGAAMHVPEGGGVDLTYLIIGSGRGG